MLRRWLIRVPCLWALTLVVGVWVGSYFGGLYLDDYSRGRWLGVGAIQGLGYVAEDGTYAYPIGTFSLEFARGAKAQDLFYDARTWGFYCGRWRGNSSTFEVIFTLWLPTLLLAGLNWFVWRKTRPTYNGKGARR